VASTLSQQQAFELLRNQEWRLRNLYKIKDKEGNVVDFKPNWAQASLKNCHNLNIVLKARQLGITTYHALLFLDHCLFQPNTNAAVVADSKDIAREIFIDKVKFAYDNLPQFVRDMCHAYRDNVHEMRFSNGSVFRVATALRGGTLQYLHITEFAKVCQENPTKANEIISGALNAVQAGQFVCIESTARGRDGHFYGLCKSAQETEELGLELGLLDWKLWFFPWWRHPDYVLNSKNVLINKDMEEYFKDLESKRIILIDEQKAWYVKKMQTQGEYMQREYPSTPEEAFATANEGYYFSKQMSAARTERRICHLPYDEHAKTYTAWDIGVSDTNVIWVFQLVGKEVRCIDYYENSDEALSHYVKWLKERPYMYEKHFFPHDAAARSLQSGKSLADVARGMGLKVEVLPRDTNEMFGIECLRNMLPRFFFEQSKCSKGIKALEAFRKEWNEKLGCYREKSLHDWASHASKALIYCAEAVIRTTNGNTMTAEQWNNMRRSWL
jgi:hypothetical protein